jgi:hypothetical protein
LTFFTVLLFFGIHTKDTEMHGLDRLPLGIMRMHSNSMFTNLIGNQLYGSAVRQFIVDKGYDGSIGPMNMAKLMHDLLLRGERSPGFPKYEAAEFNSRIQSYTGSVGDNVILNDSLRLTSGNNYFVGNEAMSNGRSGGSTRSVG